MQGKSFEQLANKLKVGRVYRREDLLPYSKAVDRDLMTLSDQKILDKVAPGLYYMPKHSRFGDLPPDEKLLVRAFLKSDEFLLFSRNLYNSLGLGFTQLYNQTVVYNHKRHGVFTLAGKVYDFRRPNNGFPVKLTQEFLLVDMVNHINELADENSEHIKFKIKNHVSKDLLKKAVRCAKKYGKVGTKKFFEEISL